jgi:RHS repeat-associated protein
VAGATETYAYDGDGVRFSRTVGGGPAIRYVSDVNVSLPVTLDDGTRKYVWGLGLAYAVSGSDLEIYHADRLRSVRAITDATGAVTATYRTDEFGVPTVTTGTSAQPFHYAGEPLDTSGLTYLRARYYEPSLGRFMSRDMWSGAIRLTATLNRYMYVGSNPTTLADPSGLKALILDPGPDGPKPPPRPPRVPQPLEPTPQPGFAPPSLEPSGPQSGANPVFACVVGALAGSLVAAEGGAVALEASGLFALGTTAATVSGIGLVIIGIVGIGAGAFTIANTCG